MTIESRLQITAALKETDTPNTLSTIEWKTTLGTFNTRMRERLTNNGQMVYIIEPQGEINHLPSIAGTRKSKKRQHYTILANGNFYKTMIYFLEKLEINLLQGETLFKETPKPKKERKMNRHGIFQES